MTADADHWQRIAKAQSGKVTTSDRNLIAQCCIATVLIAAGCYLGVLLAAGLGLL